MSGMEYQSQGRWTCLVVEAPSRRRQPPFFDAKRGRFFGQDFLKDNAEHFSMDAGSVMQKEPSNATVGAVFSHFDGYCCQLSKTRNWEQNCIKLDKGRRIASDAGILIAFNAGKLFASDAEK